MTTNAIQRPFSKTVVSLGIQKPFEQHKQSEAHARQTKRSNAARCDEWKETNRNHHGHGWRSTHSGENNNMAFKQSRLTYSFVCLVSLLLGGWSEWSAFFVSALFAVQKSGGEAPRRERCRRICTGMNDNYAIANQSPAFAVNISIGSRERCCTSSPRAHLACSAKKDGCALLGMLRTKTPRSIAC